MLCEYYYQWLCILFDASNAYNCCYRAYIETSFVLNIVTP